MNFVGTLHIQDRTNLTGIVRISMLDNITLSSKETQPTKPFSLIRLSFVHRHVIEPRRSPVDCGNLPSRLMEMCAYLCDSVAYRSLTISQPTTQPSTALDLVHGERSISLCFFVAACDLKDVAASLYVVCGDDSDDRYPLCFDGKTRRATLTNPRSDYFAAHSILFNI